MRDEVLTSDAMRDAGGRWPHRCAVVLACGALLLVLAGGLVTTYRVGMAVPDWPTTFGYGMFSYPLDRMLENFGVTIEHGHRLIASLVGLASIVAMLVAAAGAARGARVLAWLAVALELAAVAAMLAGAGDRGLSSATLAILGGAGAAIVAATVVRGAGGAFRAAALVHLAVLGQGLLGGSRVLQNDATLAFLHGAFAQIVYAAMGAFVVTSSPAWRRAPGARREGDEHGVRVRAIVALVIVYAQIVVGAWLRHSGAQDALGLHVLLGLGAAGALLALAGAMRESGAASLRRLRPWILGLLGAQLALGLATTFAILVLSGGFQSAVSVTEAVAATAHVAVGALLLACTLAAVLWSWRLFRAPASGVKELREQHA